MDLDGDHPHTNFRHLFERLTRKGYFVEVLGTDYTCFNARNFGTLLVVDTEEEFFREEIQKIKRDVEVLGLNLIVAADWFNHETLKKVKFFDENTQSDFVPLTGGANIPALNDLLQSFGIAFSDDIVNGVLKAGKSSCNLGTSSTLHTLPKGAHVLTLQNKPIVSLIKAKRGNIAVFGDASSWDGNWWNQNCLPLLDSLLLAVLEGGTADLQMQK